MKHTLLIPAVLMATSLTAHTLQTPNGTHAIALPPAGYATPELAGRGFLVREVALQGTLAEMLSVITVCEWSYLSWGEKVVANTVRGTEKTSFCTYEWVDLHSGDYFTSVVNYLKGLLDKEGKLIDEDGRKACQKRFLEAVQCEEDFFNFAYEG